HQGPRAGGGSTESGHTQAEAGQGNPRSIGNERPGDRSLLHQGEERKVAPNQRLKLTGAAILVLRVLRFCRRPRQVSGAFGGGGYDGFEVGCHGPTSAHLSLKGRRLCTRGRTDWS